MAVLLAVGHGARDIVIFCFRHKNHGLERSAHDYHCYDNIN